MLESVGDWFLGSVRVLVSTVDAHFGEDLAAEAVVRDHATDGEGEHLLRAAGSHALGAVTVLAADETGKTGILLVDFLFAGEDGFLGIDDDDVVAIIDVGSVGDFVFPPEEVGSFDGNSTNDALISINDEPFPVLFFVLGGECFHGRVESPAETEGSGPGRGD